MEIAVLLISIFALFQIKHLIVDFLLQPRYEWSNKGTYGHWGGIRHALKQAIGTAVVAAMLPHSVLWMCFTFAFLAEFAIHYHIDWAKMNINRVMGWGANTHAEFWYLTGFDQFLHQMTFLLIAFVIVYFGL